MKAIKRVDVAVLMILFLVNPCFGQNDAKQIWTEGVEHAAQGNFNEAKEEFEKALKVDPSYGSAKRALKVIEDALDQKIKSKTAIHLFQGIAYGIKGQWDESIAEINKALELNPRYGYIYVCRGLTYANKGQYDKAIADYTKAIEINPRSDIAYNNRGVAYAKKGQFDKAITDNNKAIELNPKYAYAYNNSVKHYFLLDIIIHPYILLTS